MTQLRKIGYDKLYFLSHQLQTSNISPRLLGNTIKMGVKMYRWGMMVWLKGENCMKQLQEMVHTYIKTHKRNNHLIRFHTKGMVAWSETYIWVYKYICPSYVKRNIKQLFAEIVAFISLIFYTWYRIHIYTKAFPTKRSNPYKRLNRWYLLHLAECYSRS